MAAARQRERLRGVPWRWRGVAVWVRDEIGRERDALL
jgi:hypothetical protein